MDQNRRLCVILRVNASEKFGFGHLNRIQILAENLRAEVNSILLINDNVENKNFIVSKDVKFIAEEASTDNWPDADCCIVDLYQIDDSFYRALKKKYNKIIMFDDFMYSVPKSVDAVINPNLYASENTYYGQKDTAFFVGSKYILIRNDLLGNKQRDNAEGVFLCMGGSDPENQTIRLLEILLKVTQRPIFVVLGPGYEQTDAIDKYSKYENINLYHNPINLGDLMANSAYAVTGAGTMLYEFGHLGVPTACLSLADNQKLIADSFKKKDAALYLGFFDSVDDKTIADSLYEFDSGPDHRKKIKNNAMTLIDGKGGQRLATDILNWLKAEI